MKKLLLAITSAALLTACGGNDSSTATTPETKKDSIPQTCTYSYDPASTTIGFGAFKFTEKKEVKGGFLKFTVDSTKEDSRPFAVIDGAVFKIDIEGLDTKDQARDFNIKSSFFAKMDSTSFITGRVKELGLNDGDSSTAFVILKINNIEKEIELHMSLEGDILSLTGTINLNDFKAQKALASLNTTCKDLHKGADGKSVTWPEVNIYVSTTLKKNCK